MLVLPHHQLIALVLPMTLTYSPAFSLLFQQKEDHAGLGMGLSNDFEEDV